MRSDLALQAFVDLEQECHADGRVDRDPNTSLVSEAVTLALALGSGAEVERVVPDLTDSTMESLARGRS